MNLICGINPVLEALNAGTRHFDRLIVVKGLRNQRIADAIARAGKLGVPLRFESRDTLDRLSSGVPHQGLIAVVSAKPTVDLDSVLLQAREPALVVALDGVEDPRNLGAILRTCEAAGADGVLLPERHSVGLTETVNRASAGALEHVKVARVGNLAQAIEAMKARGLWVIGFDAEGGRRWDAVDYKRPMALVMGGEGRGMRRLVRERCDELVSIPLFGHVTSLNVSVAAGIALYEVIRQRGAMPSHVRPIPPRAQPPQRQVQGPAEDDSEHDPGGPPRVFAPPADDEFGDDELEHPLYVVREVDEELAWGRAMESSAAPEPRARERERERERDRDRRPHEPAQRGGEGGGPPGPGGPGRQGRGRRRRRRHGGEDGRQRPHQPHQNQPSNQPHPQQRPENGENRPENGPSQGQPHPGGHPGRRRRRRWRGRRGGGAGGGQGGGPPQ